MADILKRLNKFKAKFVQITKIPLGRNGLNAAKTDLKRSDRKGDIEGDGSWTEILLKNRENFLSVKKDFFFN